jgi:hypothetical protein
MVAFLMMTAGFYPAPEQIKRQAAPRVVDTESAALATVTRG